MSMARVIEFHTLARFTPTVKWVPDEQRGKIIPFTSQRREASDEQVCAAYEEIDSQSSRWPERDAPPCQILRLSSSFPKAGGALFEELFERDDERIFDVIHLVLFPDGSPVGS
jgi:hypothetical protein